VFPLSAGKDNIYINGGIVGTAAMMQAVNKLEQDQVLQAGDILIAARMTNNNLDIAAFHEHVKGLAKQYFEGDILEIKNLWDIFSFNDRVIREDFQLITAGRTSAPIPGHITVAGKENLFIEEGANIYAGCIINATTGPIYIAKDTEILEGTMMRGPVAICEHSVTKMGAKVYGATTLGPGCKVGGELSNVVFFANSNKAHDGYLGNSVIGEWCNLGADTNCSNLKNNYDGVQVWSEAINKSVDTGLTFCGLMMADHSKCAINTMFNTGTVVAVSCNIFGAGFPGKFIASFSWGGSEKTITYTFDKSMDTANRMMGRRGKQLSENEIEMYRYIFDNYRRKSDR
jgi:UDP-N-acetylglucosamine diphosphorylase/glucosamine-1-phosphate N-acetyltransferase